MEGSMLEASTIPEVINPWQGLPKNQFTICKQFFKTNPPRLVLKNLPPIALEIMMLWSIGRISRVQGDLLNATGKPIRCEPPHSGREGKGRANRVAIPSGSLTVPKPINLSRLAGLPVL